MYRVLILCCLLGPALCRQPDAPHHSADRLPDTAFTCRDKVLGGYYADPDAQCQMFHVCVKVAGVGIQDFRFLCPNGTAFDQEAQICASWGDVACDTTALYYSSDNFDLYRIGSGFESKKAPVAFEDEPDFHLQRAEPDILSGAHSSNFFNNRGGKEVQDTPKVSTQNRNVVDQQPQRKKVVKKLQRRPTEVYTTTTTTSPSTTQRQFTNNFAGSFVPTTSRPYISSSATSSQAPKYTQNGNDYQRFNNNYQTQKQFSSPQYDTETNVKTSQAPIDYQKNEQYNQNKEFRSFRQRPTSTTEYNYNTESSVNYNSRAPNNNYNNEQNYQSRRTQTNRQHSNYSSDKKDPKISSQTTEKSNVNRFRGQQTYQNIRTSSKDYYSETSPQTYEKQSSAQYNNNDKVVKNNNQQNYSPSSTQIYNNQNINNNEKSNKQQSYNPSSTQIYNNQNNNNNEKQVKYNNQQSYNPSSTQVYNNQNSNNYDKSVKFNNQQNYNPSTQVNNNQNDKTVKYNNIQSFSTPSTQVYNNPNSNSDFYKNDQQTTYKIKYNTLSTPQTTPQYNQHYKFNDAKQTSQAISSSNDEIQSFEKIKSTSKHSEKKSQYNVAKQSTPAYVPGVPNQDYNKNVPQTPPPKFNTNLLYDNNQQSTPGLLNHEIQQFKTSSSPPSTPKQYSSPSTYTNNNNQYQTKSTVFDYSSSSFKQTPDQKQSTDYQQYSTPRPVPSVSYNQQYEQKSTAAPFKSSKPEDYDDGQYRPEIYEREAGGAYDVTVKQNERKESTSKPVQEQEFLKTAHSINIAASGNQIARERENRPFISYSPSSTTSAPSTHQKYETTTQFARTAQTTLSARSVYSSFAAVTSAAPRPFSLRPEKSSVPPPAKKATVAKASPPSSAKSTTGSKTKDVSYDYAYYDNSDHYSEYENIEEFGRTSKKH